MFHTYSLGILLCVAGSLALYEPSAGVVDLTPSNFDKLVLNSDEVWIVEFYAPWCGHCKNLVPEYKKTAKALKGIAKVGAVDADQHKSLSSKYGVSGFPTIKIFTNGKHTPYQGARTAEGFVDAAIKAAKDKAYENLGKKTSRTSDQRFKSYPKKAPRLYGGWDKKRKQVLRSGPDIDYYHELNAKKSSGKVYGHHIPWIDVKKQTFNTGATLKQLESPYVVAHTPDTRFELLQMHLFRRSIDSESPELVKKRVKGTKSKPTGDLML